MVLVVCVKRFESLSKISGYRPWRSICSFMTLSLYGLNLSINRKRPLVGSVPSVPSE